MFKNWLSIATHIQDNAENLQRFECPKCGQHQIDYLYSGDLKRKIGYLSVWYQACLHGIRVSRVGIPDGDFKKVDFEDRDEKFVVPDFKEIF